MEQRFSDLIIRLANGISQRRMYFDTHPRVLATSREVAADLTAMLRETGADGFSFGVYGGKFVRNGRYLVGPSIAGRALIDFAERLGCGGFTFRLPVEPEHLGTFFRLGAARMERPDSLSQAQALLDSHGIGHVTLARPVVESEGNTLGSEPEDPLSSAANGLGGGGTADLLAVEFAPLLQLYQSMYDTVANNTIEVHRNGAVDIDQATEAGLQLVDMTDRGALDVMQFMRYPDYDSYTVGHSVRVAALSTMVARELGWSREILAELATAGLLHDLGKGRIPEEILFKPGKLDADERRIIETHPALGAEILLDSGEDSALILSATWGHHLRHDTGGYPVMPDWHRPGAVAEIVHVCDVFEALTAHRPYKKPMSPRRAYEILLNDAGAYHPRMLAALIKTLGLYPPGSEVVLNDQSTAVVVSRGPALDRPRVRVTIDATGAPIPRDDQPAVDLHAAPELEVLDIMSVGAPGDWGDE